MEYEQITPADDVFAHHGRQLILAFHNSEKERIALEGPPVPQPTGPARTSQLPARIGTKEEADAVIKQKVRDVIDKVLSSTQGVSLQTRSDELKARMQPVGILGAGPAGLYTALILDDLGIPYKIIESQRRVGGRLFTYTFKDSTGAPYNYYDVGAMRFPEIEAMRRVFRLFAYPPLNSAGISLQNKLKPFYFTGVPDHRPFRSFNGVALRQDPSVTTAEFKARQMIRDTDPTPYLAADVPRITDDVIKPYATELLDDLRTGGQSGWFKLMKLDNLSARAFMSTQYIPSRPLNLPPTPLSTDVVNWCETFEGSTGAYDRGFTEKVLDAISFGWHPPTSSDQVKKETTWHLIDGGSSEIAESMKAYIQRRQPQALSLGQRATKISREATTNGPLMIVETVSDQGSRTTEGFSHVVCTIPLPVLRTMNLTRAELSVMQSNAIRQLTYSASIKVGMQFKTAWWTTARDNNGQPLTIIGGQTYSDSPLKNIVYPSYGDALHGNTFVLIASYCSVHDAERLGALVALQDKTRLRELVIRELARIHNLSIRFLEDQLIDTFAHDWSRDPNSMGAFAYFGPGKFGNPYSYMTRPAAQGRLHFASEALSVRHAWVEGALDSAWRAVYEMLLGDDLLFPYFFKFIENWGTSPEWMQLAYKPTQRGGDAPELDFHKMLQNSLLLDHLVLGDLVKEVA